MYTQGYCEGLVTYAHGRFHKIGIVIHSTEDIELVMVANKTDVVHNESQTRYEFVMEADFDVSDYEGMYVIRYFLSDDNNVKQYFTDTNYLIEDTGILTVRLVISAVYRTYGGGLS